ncbi:MAG: large subunit ribosomal protein L3 [Microgenomates group bacterium LiPW_16]|nr:MAG: large subunit ribosomal protein L3 [Microgenomates group bacterium LiPW_16]
MNTSIKGKKIGQTRIFTEEGKQIPVTRILLESSADLAVGDKVKVTGTSKGKGFAGVVKRWGFAGGPRTRGQSDRERAPGSIGQTTTPGRVYKGKKMAGRMGGKRVTIKGLKVVEIKPEENLLIVKGLVPGPKRGKVLVSKV